MTTFDDRERAFEAKFAQDESLKFLAEHRRNRLAAIWAAERLGLAGADREAYVDAVRRVDLGRACDRDVARRLAADFAAHGLAVTESEVADAMARCMAEAVLHVGATATSQSA